MSRTSPASARQNRSFQIDATNGTARIDSYFQPFDPEAGIAVVRPEGSL